MSLEDIQETWRNHPGARASMIRSLAGLVRWPQTCKACGNEHRAAWLAAVCDAKHQGSLGNGAGLPGHVGSDKEREIRDLLEECLDLARNPRRNFDGQLTDCLRVLTTGAPETEWTEPEAPIATDSIVVVSARPRANPVPERFAARLEVRALKGKGRSYPVCCQAFLGLSKDFLTAIDRAFILAGRNEHQDWVWTLRQPRQEPPDEYTGRSFEGAWALLGVNLKAKLSPMGFVTLPGDRRVWEVNLYDIAVSARVNEDATLGCVKKESVSEKQIAATEAGARAFIVAKGQEGLAALEPPFLTRWCESLHEVLAILDELQAETITAWLSSRPAGAHFLLTGSLEFIWITFLISLGAWLYTAGWTFLLPPFAWSFLWLFMWPKFWSKILAVDKLELPRDATRTVLGWSHMLERVTARVEGCAAGAARPVVVSTCRWLKEGFATAAEALESGTAQGRAARRFSREEFTPALLDFLCLAVVRRRFALLAGPTMALAMLILVGIMLSPLQYRLAEALPPWGGAALTGGFASMSDLSGDRTLPHFLNASNGSSKVFVAAVGQQGKLHLTSSGKRRASRRMRLHCSNCRVSTAADHSLAPVVALDANDVDVDYWIPAGVTASLEVELLTEWGHQLATASVQFVEVNGR
jgi:hypothetical protein